MRETVIAGVAAYLDGQFFTNTVTLSANLRPAAITNGATAITSTGSTAAQINADLAGMLAAITTDGGGLVWIMRPTDRVQDCGDDRRDRGGGYSAHVVRDSAGAQHQFARADHARRRGAHSLQRHRRIRRLDLHASGDSARQRAHRSAGGRDGHRKSLSPRNLFGVRVTRWLAYLRAQTGASST